MAAAAVAVREGYLALWRALVAKMDADGDGRISEEEFLTSVGRSIVVRPDGFDNHLRPLAEALMGLTDTDGDEQVSPNEFTALFGALGAAGGDAAHAFSVLDRDGNGHLSTEEIIDAIREYYTSPDPDAPGNLLFGDLTVR
ncbi:calcium-binding protein [Catellatospora sp. TT07R-123]|uniref:EF-hand domain-containing protein n=1 Tax=Catellatospora sp. TT07R-123 TaxID=2733863 RepID=UPI001B090B45|nr:EF-hand domain-containing protein [Catellatospora sp. TT07R-123]GHJ43046.1 calcium-binding protein [Catellatospora sp. TT07R-123]